MGDNGPITEVLANASFQQEAIDALTTYTKERLDNLAYDAIHANTHTIPPREQDFDCLRDLLVDMCSATLPEHPPSPKDWTEIRDRVRAAAVKHSHYNRDEKKAILPMTPLTR